MEGKLKRNKMKRKSCPFVFQQVSFEAPDFGLAKNIWDAI
jgi:hypothetical protein